MNLGLFFVYTGLEVSAGQWAYSLFTEGRGIEPAVAGVYVGVYWGSLTVGRLVAGALTTALSATALLRMSMSVAPVGALLMSIDQSHLASFLGLSLVGFALAPIYPLLISETPRRLGAAYASQAIGFQVAAGYLGAAALPSLVGALAHGSGLETIGFLLVAVALTLLMWHELALWHIRYRRSVREVATAMPGQAIGRAWLANGGE